MDEGMTVDKLANAVLDYSKAAAKVDGQMMLFMFAVAAELGLSQERIDQLWDRAGEEV